MGDKLPKLTAKEAEALLLQNGFVIIGKKVVIESIKKTPSEWFCHTIVEKHYTQSIKELFYILGD